MLGFGGIPVIAIGAYDSGLPAAITYDAVSRLASGGSQGRQENNLADVYLWEDGVPLLWDDGLYITIYG